MGSFDSRQWLSVALQCLILFLFITFIFQFREWQLYASTHKKKKLVQNLRFCNWMEFTFLIEPLIYFWLDFHLKFSIHPFIRRLAQMFSYLYCLIIIFLWFEKAEFFEKFNKYYLFCWFNSPNINND